MDAVHTTIMIMKGTEVCMTFEEFKHKFNITLNPQQEQAVQRVNGNTLLLAVPGSGKTTVIVTRLGYMVYCLGIDPADILTMTYTVAATNDMRERFREKFGDEYADQLEFRTINGVCTRIIMKKYPRLPRLLTGEGSNSNGNMVTRAIMEVTGEFPSDGAVADAVLHIAYSKNMMLNSEQRMRLADGFEPIFQAYNQFLRMGGWMDYDDQLVLAYDALKRDAGLLNYFKGIYKYINVDEAQDTSYIQHKIIELLAGHDGNLFMVGDEDQSIYGFRAAYPQALMDFSKTYNDANVLLMEQNYRSSANIVKAANRFIRRNHHRYDKTMKTDHPDGDQIVLTHVMQRDQQPQHIVNRLANAHGAEIAVLYRNNDSIIPVIDLLNRRGISYKHRGAETLFFSNPIVCDMVGLMRMSADMCIAEPFIQSYYKLGFGMKKTLVEGILKNKPDDMTVFQALMNSNEIPDVYKRKLAVREKQIIGLYRMPTISAIECILKDMEYGKYLKNRGTDSSGLAILQMLALQNPNTAYFPKRIDELKEIVESGGAKRSNIILSTIHSSKGLEYDNVILFDLVQGVFPSKDSEEDDDLKEEENRLFYVGMTRARYHLECIYQNADFVMNLLPPTAPNKSNNTLFELGEYVQHPQFGIGVVQYIEGDIATIHFLNAGTRQILLSMGLLTRVVV